MGTGLGALLFIGLATAVMRDALIEQFVLPWGDRQSAAVLADRPAALPQQPAAARRLVELVDKLYKRAQRRGRAGCGQVDVALKQG